MPLTEFFLLPLPPSPQDDPVTNLNNAFEVAEKYLDIPKMLDAEGKYIPLFSQHLVSLGMTYGNQKAGSASENGRRNLGEAGTHGDSVSPWEPEQERCAQAGHALVEQGEEREGGLEEGPLWGLPLGPGLRHPAEPCLTQSHPSLWGASEVAREVAKGVTPVNKPGLYLPCLPQAQSLEPPK